jgi:hypothetical protein
MAVVGDIKIRRRMTWGRFYGELLYPATLGAATLAVFDRSVSSSIRTPLLIWVLGNAFFQLLGMVRGLARTGRRLDIVLGVVCLCSVLALAVILAVRW